MQEEVEVEDPDPEAALEARRAAGQQHLQRVQAILQTQRTVRHRRVNGIARPLPGPSRLRMQLPAPPSPEPVSPVQQQDSVEGEALEGLMLLFEDLAPDPAAPPPPVPLRARPAGGASGEPRLIRHVLQLAYRRARLAFMKAQLGSAPGKGKQGPSFFR